MILFLSNVSLFQTAALENKSNMASIVFNHFLGYYKLNMKISFNIADKFEEIQSSIIQLRLGTQYFATVYFHNYILYIIDSNCS